jgi:periodic tryptophan protein 2
VFGRSRAVEPFQLNSDVLAIAFRPDGKELAASTLDGSIVFWDVINGKQINLIEGRKDVSGGRKADDRVSASNNASGKAFNSLAYTADGTCLLAGGNSKYVLLYDAREGVMLKKFQISENLSLDGTQEFLDSRLVTEAGGPVYDAGDESDLEDRLDRTLPGAARGDLSKRKYKQEARTKCVRFSPTGRIWAAASTEGLLIYSLDENVTFDPFSLDIELTPQAILAVLANREYLKALVMAFRLNEKALIQRAYESVPPGDIRLVARQLPLTYLPAMLRFLGSHVESSPHMEYDLLWINALLSSHGRYLRDHSTEYASVFRAIQKGANDFQRNISTLLAHNTFRLPLCYTDRLIARCEDNTSVLSYVLDQRRNAQLGVSRIVDVV